MIGFKELYKSMTRFKSPFGKTCATVGAFSGFFGVNSYYFKKNCNIFENEINLNNKIIINDNQININDHIIIDNNSITVSNKKIKNNNKTYNMFKINGLDYLMIHNAPYYVNFSIGTIIGSAIGYIYGIYFPITIPLTVAYSVITNIIESENCDNK